MTALQNTNVCSLRHVALARGKNFTHTLTTHTDPVRVSSVEIDKPVVYRKDKCWKKEQSAPLENERAPYEEHPGVIYACDILLFHSVPEIYDTARGSSPFLERAKHGSIASKASSFPSPPIPSPPQKQTETHQTLACHRKATVTESERS